MTATKVTTKPPSEAVLKARDDFYDFCCFMGKKPAKHMMEWHNELCTGEDSECLLGIGGPNTSILAPRGSAKSTVLGLFAAWMIGDMQLPRKCCAFCTLRTWWTLVVQSQQLSKEF